MTSLTDLRVTEAGRALRSGGFSSGDLVEAHLSKIEAADRHVGAFVTVCSDLARKAAEQADRDFRAGIDRGPLQGIPFAVKDLLDVQGFVTGCGSNAAPVRKATRDATVIRRLLDQGAVLLGKLATYEYALNGPSFGGPVAPPRNPWNRDHITGGSSSGSAAAVSAGMVRLAIGTDTGGSVRSPAGYCGIVGLKPTFGLVPVDGVFPLSPTLDNVGPMAATVAEAELALSAMTGRVVQPWTAERGLAGVRIAYARDWFAEDPACAPEIIDALDAAVSELSMLGAAIDLVTLPEYALMESAGAVILHAEALATHRDALVERSDKYGRLAYRSLIAGASLKKGDVELAREAGRHFRSQVDDLLSTFDVIVTATTLTTAPPFSRFTDGAEVWTPMRTLPFNLTGHPALAVPAGLSAGLPMSMQIVGRHGDEATICRIGAAFEAATDHSVQRPYTLT